MTKVLLIFHVLAAVIAIGPVTAAGSMFPVAARKASAVPGDADAAAAVRLLHRICRVYAVIGLAIPVFGFATASSMHVLGSPWLVTAMILTGIAALVLALLVLPAQEAILAGLAGGETWTAHLGRARARQLAALTGLFSLLWATVTVLMIVRPGSTTGA